MLRLFGFPFFICVIGGIGGLPAFATPPEPVPGTLILAGEGEGKAARDEFFKLAGGKGKARILIVPTARASAGEAADDAELLKPWADLGPDSVGLLHTRDPKTANDPAFVKQLADATGVWIAHGHPDRLCKAYAGTLVAKELKKLLDRGGVVGGAGAGAAVLSDRVIEKWDDNAIVRPGLGLMPGFLIDRNFRDPKSEKPTQAALESNPGYAGLGLDRDAAVVVRGRTLRVIGEGSATASWAKSATKPHKDEVVKSGGRLDLFQVRRAAAFRALPEPFPAKDAAEPNVKNGSLVIVGGGGTTPEIMNRFFDLAGGKDSLIVVIPTASEQEKVPDDPGDARYLRRFGATNVKVLHTRDRKQADEPEFSKVLSEAKGIWFGGGRQWRFVDAYEGTLTAKRFQEVLDRGGVIGGSSAGASIQSEYMPRGHPLGNTVMAAEGYERGFGYLPGCAVDQHFFARNRTADMTGLMKLYPQILGIGIDESTAIVVTGHTAEVIGKSKVGFYDYRKGEPKGEKDYTEVKTGEKYDLKERKAVSPTRQRGSN
jgi:cyanophycinase